LSIFAGVTSPAATGSATATDDLDSPRGVAIDPSTGVMFIADTYNDVIEAVSPTGQLSVIAGRTGRQGAPTPGLATNSDLSSPQGVAIDSATGDVFIADSGNDVVEKVTPAGQLSVVAGQVGESGRPTPGLATSSELGDPSGVAVDSANGDVFIADSAREVIEQVTPAGQLSILAGRIDHTNVPTPGPATKSDLNSPEGVAVDPTNGAVYIADSANATVDEVVGGQLSVLVGTAGQASVPSPGPASSSSLDGPLGVAVDNAGDVFIADTRNDVVEEVTSAGQLSILAGETFKSGTPKAGPATSTEVNSPAGIAVNPATGDVFLADTGNSLIEQITPAGSLSIVAGRATSGAPTPGPASLSALSNPSGVAFDPTNGLVFIADSGNDVIEEVTPAGQLTIVAGQVGKSGKVVAGPATGTELGSPSGLAVDPNTGDLFIADGTNDVIEEVTPAGQLSIVAGVVGKSGVPTTGPATSSDLGDPTGVAFDPTTGDLFISDSKNAVVEEVASGGQLSILAGSPGHGGLPIPGPATASYLNAPGGVAVDPTTGNVFIADTTNQSIEEVTPAGQLSVLAGIADNLDYPSGIAVDAATGDLFIGDTDNDVVRELSSSGQLSVVAGQLAVGGSPLSGRATSSRLTSPKGVAFDPSTATLFIADSGNNDVDEVVGPAPAPPPTVTRITPDSGSVSGGTVITVTGAGFVPGATVLLTQGHETTDATHVTVISSTKLTAVTGAAKAGTWAVRVVEPAGTSASGHSYHYLPTVTSVSPRTGPDTGRTRITVKGTGFVKGAKVVITQRRGTTKALKATHVKVVSPTKITAVTAGNAKSGTWRVLVIERGVTSAPARSDRYRYTP
jgi:DNA-binding beta-propeller fold protein YncE